MGTVGAVNSSRWRSKYADQILQWHEEEKRLIAQHIEEERLKLNASLVVMVSDVWVGIRR